MTDLGHLMSDESCLTRFLCGGDLNPPFNYAAFHWDQHVPESEDDRKTSHMTLNFLISFCQSSFDSYVIFLMQMRLVPG